jgi:hypothetical protein
MTLDVEKPRIANVTTETDEHEEIEITPEMVEAGEIAYYDAPRWAKDGELAERAVKRIYLAMEAARIDAERKHQSRGKGAAKPALLRQ